MVVFANVQKKITKGKKKSDGLYILCILIGFVLSGGCFCGNQGQEKMWKWYLVTPTTWWLDLSKEEVKNGSFFLSEISSESSSKTMSRQLVYADGAGWSGQDCAVHNIFLRISFLLL